MKTFEYKTIKIDSKFSWTKSGFESDRIDEELNIMGREGWELVTAESAISTGGTYAFLYTFKRER
ncbi:DUF4177 domain-containing protein [Sphingobacterium pedocola]|uniref:DUF4177 domain-containing protein n=1 Tax=Sphingobacterium pedocola TaxID=2082722 RepID=A0ABR9T4A4_9SPHI|nr:DUF4177 domain-containing protein [Sphingobacterium pedocola]MBE8719884.1 DUF4177 domain-containing protein [Sphingobacterium pedocola]